MDKKNFYIEQAEKFTAYFKKFLPIIFKKWAESKDFSDEDKQGIWQIVRRKSNDAYEVEGEG